VVLVGSVIEVLSHDPESMISHVVALSEVLDKGYSRPCLSPNPAFEVMPKTLELAQLHTAAEEAVLTSRHRTQQRLCISEVLPGHLEPIQEHPDTDREVLSKACLYGVSESLW
jgi:hypothetical protein